MAQSIPQAETIWHGLEPLRSTGEASGLGSVVEPPSGQCEEGAHLPTRPSDTCRNGRTSRSGSHGTGRNAADTERLGETSWGKRDLNWADGGGRNRAEAPGWQHPMARVEGVVDKV